MVATLWLMVKTPPILDCAKTAIHARDSLVIMVNLTTDVRSASKVSTTTKRKWMVTATKLLKLTAQRMLMVPQVICLLVWKKSMIKKFVSMLKLVQSDLMLTQ